MTQQEAERLLGFSVGDGWTFTAVNRGGELAGFVMQRGAEVHAYRLPSFNGRWFTRQDVERVLLPILKTHGEVTTKVRADNTTGRKFVTRLGFVKVGDSSDVHIFRATRFNHARL